MENCVYIRILLLRHILQNLLGNKTKQSYIDLTFCELKKTQIHESCYFLCDTLNCIYKLMISGLKLEHFMDLNVLRGLKFSALSVLHRRLFVKIAAYEFCPVPLI